MLKSKKTLRDVKTFSTWNCNMFFSKLYQFILQILKCFWRTSYVSVVLTLTFHMVNSFKLKTLCQLLNFPENVATHCFLLRHHSPSVPRNTPEWIIQNKIYLINCSSSFHTGWLHTASILLLHISTSHLFRSAFSPSLQKHMKYLCWFFNLILSHKRRVCRINGIWATITFSRMREKNVSTKRYLSF